MLVYQADSGVDTCADETRDLEKTRELERTRGGSKKSANLMIDIRPPTEYNDTTAPMPPILVSDRVGPNSEYGPNLEWKI